MLGLIPALFCGNMVSEGAARQSAGKGAGRGFIFNSCFESFNSISDFRQCAIYGVWSGCKLQRAVSFMFSYVSYGFVFKAMCLISEIKIYQLKNDEYSNTKDYMIVLSVSIILCRSMGNISSFMLCDA